MILGSRQVLLSIVLAISGTEILAESPPAQLLPEPLLELYSPGDAEGFLIPRKPSEIEAEPLLDDSGAPQLEEAEDSASPLTIWSTNDAGFLHQGRRKARVLNLNALPLPKRARIYTGARGLIVLGAPKRFYGLLEAKTALHSAETEKGWRWTLLDGEARLRLSCLGEAPLLRWKNSADELWEQIKIKPTADADLILLQDAGSLALYQLRGASKLIMPTARLLPGRPASLVRSLQDEQLSTLKDGKGRTRIELYPGQVLHLVKQGSAFQLTIGLPDPSLWGENLLLSSPETLYKDPDSEITEGSLEKLRRTIVEERIGSLVPSEESILKLLSEGHYEESLYLFRRLSIPEQRRMGPRLNAIESLLLYRLQQVDPANELSTRLPEADAWLPLLAEEKRLATLRSKAVEPSKLIYPHTKHLIESLKSYERYSLALSWQQLDRTRQALDTWMLPINDTSTSLRAKSESEWLEQLLELKRWFLEIDLSFGYDTNVLSSPADEDTLSVYGRRDSFLGLLNGSLERVLDRSSVHRFALRLSTQSVFYGHARLSGLGLLDFRLSLPLSLDQLIMDQVRIEPFLGLRQRGSDAALDLFGMKAASRLVLSSGTYELELDQMLGLDRDPEGSVLFDVETGERGVEGDQSLKKTQAEFSWVPQPSGSWRFRYSLGWEQLDYRGLEHRTWDKNIFALTLEPSWQSSPILSAQLLLAVKLHQFDLGSMQTGGELGASVTVRSNMRWLHGLKLSLRDEASTLYQKTQRKYEAFLSSSYSW